jgi:type 1 glutamine amidotransferase
MNAMGKFLFAVVLLVLFSGCVMAADKPVRVLIYSGANNHDWAKTTPVIKKILADAGTSVDVVDKPGEVTAAVLGQVDVIVSNWSNLADKTLDWPEENRKAFLDFVSNGGGHVVVHAGGCSFYDWAQYHKIAASWGKATSHGAMHEFPVSIDMPGHAICRGVAAFKTTDELWRNPKLPQGSKVLMSAFSSKKSGGSDNNEPILAVSKYGKGRCVNFMLGHDVNTMANSGFKTVLVRSVLWAGGGKLQSRNLNWAKTDKSPAHIQ